LWAVTSNVRLRARGKKEGELWVLDGFKICYVLCIFVSCNIRREEAIITGMAVIVVFEGSSYSKKKTGPIFACNASYEIDRDNPFC